MGSEILCFSSSSRITMWSWGRGHPQREGESHLRKGERLKGQQKHRKMDLILLLKGENRLICILHISWEKHRMCTDAINLTLSTTFSGSKCIIRFTFYHCGNIQHIKFKWCVQDYSSNNGVKTRLQVYKWASQEIYSAGQMCDLVAKQELAGVIPWLTITG